MHGSWVYCGQSAKGRLHTATILFVFMLAAAMAYSQASASQTSERTETSAALTRYCATCHNAKLKTGGMVIDPSFAAFDQNAENWERVVHQLRAQSMPPPSAPRPDAATYRKVASYLESELDRSAAAKPNAGTLPHSSASASLEPDRVRERHPRFDRARSSAEGDGFQAAASRRQREQRIR
jgi:mono/diheme cytochrome c family protein